jgi:hypothetical protein
LNETIAGCQALNQQDPAWNLANAYCCCSRDFAGASQALRTGSKDIFVTQIAKGGRVLTAHLVGGASGTALAWSSAEIGFAAALENPPAGAVFISANGRELFCAPDQPVLLADGTITIAERLSLDDALVDDEGRRAPIAVLGLGEPPVALHSIGLSRPFDGSLEGRLFSLGGLIVGDFELQLALGELAPEHLAPDHGQRQPLSARIGTSAAPISFLSPGSGGVGQANLRTIQPSPVIPSNARTLFTADQSADVGTNGALRPLADKTAAENFQAAKALLQPLYPTVSFSYDAANLLPTVYAYRQMLGGKLVQVNGGLARQAKLGAEGVLMALAWGVACLYGGSPPNPDGYSAVGQADLFAFGTIGRKVWSAGSYLTSSMAALGQWQALFALVDPDHAGGDPDDPIDDPSLACRVQSIQSSIGGGSLPACAGGVPIPALDLILATMPAVGVLQLAFDQPVFNDTVIDTGNYVLDPVATIASAFLDPGDDKTVLVVASLTPGEHYRVTVKNLESADGGALNPDRGSLSFTAVT